MQSDRKRGRPMLVSNIMSKDVITLTLKSDLNEAARLMKVYEIRSETYC